MRAQAYVLAALLATVTTAGCAEYHYYDIAVSFNTAPPMNFANLNDISMVQTCTVEVTGADAASFTFGREQNCPPMSSPTSTSSQMGTFEYSSTADSGQLTFTFRAYFGFAVPECLVGEGSKTVTVGPTTLTDTLVVNRTTAVTACN